jgi:hypothetical protein
MVKLNVNCKIKEKRVHRKVDKVDFIPENFKMLYKILKT